MLRGSQRSGVPGATGVTGSALIRLLTRLTDVDVPGSRQSFAERLSQWLGWTDAIALSAALNGGPAPMPSAARSAVSADEGEFTRVRNALVKVVAADDEPMNTTADFVPFRRRYHAQQQAMETSIGPLRARLRARLAGRSPAMARLAAVDAVMEQVLGARERTLLSTVPVLLEKHFERLRRSGADDAAPPGGWLDAFRHDMHSVLLAELEIRLQPAQGLLEALRARQADPS